MDARRAGRHEQQRQGIGLGEQVMRNAWIDLEDHARPQMDLLASGAEDQAAIDGLDCEPTGTAMLFDLLPGPQRQTNQARVTPLGE